MSSKSGRKKAKFVKYIKFPFKILARARDLYVHGLTGCAGQFPAGNAAIGCPTPHFSSLQRSFSVSSTSREDDLRELIRIASTRKVVQVEMLRPPPTRVSRSRTVVIGRIDEDRPCEFVDRPVVCPRSRSCAASRSYLV